MELEEAKQILNEKGYFLSEASRNIQMVCITVKRFTTYGYNESWFDKLWGKTHDYVDNTIDKLKKKYNGQSVVKSISYRGDSDHDGNEGLFKYYIYVPQDEVKDIISSLNNIDDDFSISTNNTEIVSNKKEKPITTAKLLYDRYKSVEFRIPYVNLYGQRYRNGEPTEYVIVNESNASNSTLYKIYNNTANRYFVDAINDKNFVKKLKKDASKQEPFYLYISWLSTEGLMTLIKFAKKYPNSVNFYQEDGSVSINIPNEEKVNYLKEYLKNK